MFLWLLSSKCCFGFGWVVGNPAIDETATPSTFRRSVGVQPPGTANAPSNSRGAKSAAGNSCGLPTNSAYSEFLSVVLNGQGGIAPSSAAVDAALALAFACCCC